MTWKIEPSFGVQAHVTDGLDICLTQEQPGTTQALIFKRSEIPALIEILKSALEGAEALHKQESGEG